MTTPKEKAKHLEAQKARKVRELEADAKTAKRIAEDDKAGRQMQSEERRVRNKRK